MAKIELTDNLISAVTKLSEGNPGALHCLMEISTLSPEIDPQSAFGPLAPLLSLDTEGIYGSRIWQLYKDVCGQDARNVLILLRAKQLGFIRDVFAADPAKVEPKVKERLTEFK